MRYLYQNQGMDFDDVRADIARYFGPGHAVVIHDGDGCTLFDRVPGAYCAGTVSDPSGHTIATFAIDYITEEIEGDITFRHVVGVHIGPPGQWCRRLADIERFESWLQDMCLS